MARTGLMRDRTKGLLVMAFARLPWRTIARATSERFGWTRSRGERKSSTRAAGGVCLPSSYPLLRVVLAPSCS